MNNLEGFILAAIREHTGQQNAITAADLAAKASTFEERPVDGREVRLVVHSLRLLSQPLCSGPAGFFWPASLSDVLNCANFEFRSEARSMLQVARIMRRSGKALFGGQFGMFQ